uniref:Protein kinase domain-containing protein n=1 Tax=Denticeps clupeoides TaxID=299321 RepID=A0AAY4BW80_9TELE
MHNIRIISPFIVYDINLEPIAQGTFGKIFKATNRFTGQLVAVKVQKCLPQKVMGCLLEWELMETLAHPMIPKLIEKFYWKNLFYIFMEFYTGGDLKQLLNKTERTESKSLWIRASDKHCNQNAINRQI